MSRETRENTVTPIVISLLTILAIGMGAATLDSAQVVGGDDTNELIQPPTPGGPGPGDPGNMNDTSGDGNAPASGSNRLSIEFTYCVGFLASTLGTGLVVLGFLGFAGLIYYRYNFSAALLGSWTMLPVVLMVYFLLTNCSTGRQTSGGFGGGRSALTQESPVGISQIPPWVMGVIVGGILLGAVGLLYWSTSGEEEVVPQEAVAEEGEPELDRFAEAAGRAADRIEKRNAEVDNAVYRAWLEMTGLLDVENREANSPVDFAEEAVELGMAEDDVNELTRLFNEVRYGGRDASAREDRAVSVLRNIEAAYGDAETTEPEADSEEEQR